MLKKIKILATESLFHERGQLTHKVDTDKYEEVYFNTSLIKFVNVLKLDQKAVWKIQLMDEEVIYTFPFKM